MSDFQSTSATFVANEDHLNVSPQELSEMTDFLNKCLPEDIEAMLADLMLKEDKLDDSNFSVVDYINELFPTEQSLSNIEEVIERVEHQIVQLDEETRQVIRGQWSSEEQAEKVVVEATEMIRNLFSRIREVQEKATRSEEMVRDITRDIQQLDLAKKNLTCSITILNNIILLMSAVEKLRVLLDLEVDASTGVLLPPPQRDTSSSSNRLSTTSHYAGVGNPFADSIPQPGGSSGGTLLNWHEVADSFTPAQHVLQQLLSKYQDIPLICQLDTSISVIRQELEKRGLSEFKQMLTGPASRNLQSIQVSIQQACVVFDLLEERVKIELIDWFLQQQLSEYRVLFEETQSTAWLDKIDHRYSWLRTLLVAYEKKFRILFPVNWHVMERLILEFCRVTREDLRRIMTARRTELDSRLLVFAMQRSQAFETNLSRSVNLSTVAKLLGQHNKTKPPPVSSTSADNTVEQGDSNKPSPLDGIISSCFEEYIFLYVENVEKQLSDQLHNRLIGDCTVNQSSLQTYARDREFGDVFGNGSDSGAAPSMAPSLSSGRPGAEANKTAGSDVSENTLCSATELFLMYKKIVKQALQLTSGRRSLVPVVQLLRKYLREYAYHVLLAQLPGNAGAQLLQQYKSSSTVGSNVQSTASGGSGGTASASSVLTQTTAAMASSSLAAGSKKAAAASITFAGVTANHILSTFLKEEQQHKDSPKYEKADLEKVCVILATASYALKTTEDLEKKLKEEIQSEFKDEINFSSEMDLFDQLRKSCVQLLVNDLERACEPALYAMSKMSWSSVSKVGDTSSYITAMLSHCRTNVPVIRDMLLNVKAYFTQFCTKFANNIIAKFTATLFKCKSVSTHGAEQLLLDTHSLKTALLELPVVGSKTHPPPPRSYTNLVLQGMGKAEMIIKVVMTPTDRLTLFVESFMRLLPEADSAELQKIMDIKGMRRQDQTTVLEIFREKKPGVSPGKSTQPDGTFQNSSLALGSTQSSGPTLSGAVDQQESSRIKKLEKLIKRF